MKLHLTPGAGNAITACRDNTVYINDTLYSDSLIVLPEQLITDWQVRGSAAITPAALEQAAEHCCPGMVVLLGAGDKSPPINPSWQAVFSKQQAALEIMSLAAACRTFNFLNADGRAVMAALVLEPAGTS